MEKKSTDLIPSILIPFALSCALYLFALLADYSGTKLTIIMAVSSGLFILATIQAKKHWPTGALCAVMTALAGMVSLFYYANTIQYQAIEPFIIQFTICLNFIIWTGLPKLNVRSGVAVIIGVFSVVGLSGQSLAHLSYEPDFILVVNLIVGTAFLWLLKWSETLVETTVRIKVIAKQTYYSSITVLCAFVLSTIALTLYFGSVAFNDWQAVIAPNTAFSQNIAIFDTVICAGFCYLTVCIITAMCRLDDDKAIC